MSSQLQNFSQKNTPLVEAQLRSFFAAKKIEAAALSTPLLQSIEEIEEFVLRGGKYIRSLLTVLAFQMTGGGNGGDGGGKNLTGSSPVFQVAAGVEMFHKFILNVDDIADRDEKRYGGPTLWQFYQLNFQDKKNVGSQKNAEHQGRTFAEIDGVLMSSFVTELIRTADFPTECLLEVLGLIDHYMYLQTVAGWQIHYLQNLQSLKEVTKNSETVKKTETDYLKGLGLVTAQYSFVAPLKIGWTLANVETQNLQQKNLLTALITYGENIGRAFQIHDDILGIFGDTEETGKPVGNDIREGKKTLLLLKAHQSASKEDQQFLEKICGHDFSAKEFTRAQKIIRDTGSLAESQKMVQESIAAGKKALITLPQTKEREILEELADFVGTRKK